MRPPTAPRCRRWQSIAARCFRSLSATGSYNRSGGGGGVNQAITTATGTAITSGSGATEHLQRRRTGSWTHRRLGPDPPTVESDVAKAQASAADVAAARLSAQITLAEDYFQLRAAEEQGACTRPTSRTSGMP